MAIKWHDAGQDPHGPEKRGPSWSQLVNEAANLLGFEDPDLLRARGSDLQILEYFKLKYNGRTTLLTYWFNQFMQPPDSAITGSVIHSKLAALSKCRVFYTTNYDDFIERALELAGRQVRPIREENDMVDIGDECQVVKFHGDILTPDLMVLTESDYELRLNLRSAMDYRLRADCLNRTVLFIGYSFRDFNVSYLFRLVNDHFKHLPGCSTGRRAYIVVPDPSEFEVLLFRDRNMEVIPVRGSSIENDIAQLLDELGA